MAALTPKIRMVLLGCAAVCICGRAQGPVETPPAISSEAQPAAPPKPLPDVVAMMRDVETNEHKAEAIEKDYIYHSVATEQQVDGQGEVKKTEVVEADHYWVNGVPVRRTVKKNGNALTPEELAKEDERIDQMAAKARDRREKLDAKGKETDPRGEEEITLSRLLELGAFTNPRRVQLNGRDTIAVDYAGDPKAKTRNRAEEVIRDLVGTAWVDEQDHVLVRVEGHFVNTFKIAGGLFADIQKDTRFSMVQTKVNDEVWLPAHLNGQGAARFLVFFNFDGSIDSVYSDYRKFRTISTVLPGVTPVGTPEVPDDPAKP